MKRSPLSRRTPLRRSGIRALRTAAGRGKRDHWNHLRALVHAREGGDCARCGTPTPIIAGEAHHRLLRSRGGKDDAVTCAWLCTSCHHGWVHRNVAQATEAGWIVPGGTDPATWPVWRRHHGRWGWWQPSEDGWTEATPDSRQHAPEEAA